MPYPLLTTRLLLEPLTEADTAAFVAYRQDPEVARWQSWESSYCDADAALLIANQPPSDLPDPGGWIQLAIRDASTSELYGDVAIHVVADQPETFEIGVTLAPAVQGQGIGTEAVERVLSYLFGDAGAHSVVAFCDARNQPVARLLRRVGMRHESHQVDADFFKGEWSTLDGYAVLGRER
ncbi:MAG: GNAT family N-acetyltransferase [Actinomycetota bacterium]|nr:GNAT family N-acetyltransferase [Actinomycetota bacterium]